MQRAEENRKFCQRRIGWWLKREYIDQDQAERLLEDVKSPRTREPVVYPWLAGILEGWSWFGDPIEIASGLMLSINDRSSKLYEARLLWLSERGIEGAERELYLQTWRALDQTAYELAQEQAAKSSED